MSSAGCEVKQEVTDAYSDDEFAVPQAVTEEVIEEEMILIPEEEVYTNIDDEQFLTPPSDQFLHLLKKLFPEDDSSEIMDRIAKLSWKNYHTASQQVVLEDSPLSWMACSVYCAMVQSRSCRNQIPFTISLADILHGYNVSALEFFDKANRWVEIIGGSKRLKEFLLKVQSTLAVSAVVFKKLLPIFRRLFCLVEEIEEGSVCDITSDGLLQLIWTMYLLMRKSLPMEDLLSSFHLLLCVIENVYNEMCIVGMENHINVEFAQSLSESSESILEVLCRSFSGVVLDAKHYRAHWYNSKVKDILALPEQDTNGAGIMENWKTLLNAWTEKYETLLIRKGELDERIFLPDDIAKVFDIAYDATAVELLRRNSSDSSLADADLLLRMSTQNCLEKLADHKTLPTPMSAKSYIISSEQICPLTPLSSTSQNPSKLASIVPSDYTLQGSNLEQFCHELRDNPLPTIALNGETFSMKFLDRVKEEAECYGEEYDAVIFGAVEKHRESLLRLFFNLIEKIIRVERNRSAGRDVDFSNILRKEEFLSSVFVCAVELLLFSYGSIREFPWSCRLYEIPVLSFQKVIETVIRAESGLSREMVKHLNKKEEEILELFAWTLESPLWVALIRRADSIPSCELAWSHPRSFSNNYSPVKRRRLDENVPSPPSASNSPTVIFFRKVYYLCCIRLADLCDRVKMEERGRTIVWTLLEHVLRTETNLLVERHLDQNLLCMVYVVAKMLNVQCTFMDIMSHYRHQPQSRSQVYREVRIDVNLSIGSPSEDGNSRDSTSHSRPLRSHSAVPTSGGSSKQASPEPNANYEKVDLIIYYNKVFLPRLENFVKRLAVNDESIILIPMPSPKGFGLTPVKRMLGDRVTVVPLSTSHVVMTDRQYRYNIANSPRKDLASINRVVNSVHSHSPYYSITEVPDKASAFGPLYRR